MAEGRFGLSVTLMRALGCSVLGRGLTLPKLAPRVAWYSLESQDPAKVMFMLTSNSAQLVSSAPFSRLARLSVGGMALGALLLGVVGAFGVAPDTQFEGVDRRIVSESLELNAVETKGAYGVFWRDERVLKSDSLLSVLSRLQVDDAELVGFLQSSIRTRALPPASSARVVSTATDITGAITKIRLSGDLGVYIVSKGESGYTITADVTQTERRVVMQSGTIDSSLFAATDSVGIPDSIAGAFAELFSGELDLHRDIRRGDRFAIIYEMIYSNGYPVRPGRIVAAEFENQGRQFQAVFYENRDGSGDFYTPSGRSMRQSFLRSPLEFSRVTSGFSSNRFHPVLQVWRAHKGTDFGAPIGTRVRSTAEGVVVFAGWQNGYGKVVEVRHAGNFLTKYGHLSDFAGSIKKGLRVEQGQVLGYVGMSGLASGPHLHYEFHVNGVQADPQHAVPRQGPAISLADRDSFVRVSSESIAHLEMLRGLNVAAVE